MATSRNQAALLSVSASLLLIAAHVASRPIRDALFLSNFPVTVLPRVTIASAVVAMFCAVVVSRLNSRFPPGRLVPGVALLSATLFVGEWWLLHVSPGAGAIALYLHLAGFTAILVSGLWSVVNERFDPHSGKTIFARIGGFGALGGVMGGAAAYVIAPRIGAPAMLLGLAGLHVAAGLSILGIGQAAGARPIERATGDAASGLRILRRSPLLLRMAAMVALIGVIEELVDYAFKAEASFQYQDEASLVEFFAIFYTAASALAFLLQSAIGGAVLSRLGLGGAMALLPAGVALMGSAAVVWTRLWTVALARATNAVISVSFFRSGFELLYTPLPPETKRPTKAYIDVGGESIGKMVGGAIILSLLFVLPSLPVELVLGIAVAACLGALFLVARLQRGYVTQLADNLRTGAVSIDEDETLDATTARTIADSRVTIDRAELMARLREVQASREGAGVEGGDSDAVQKSSQASLEPHVEQVRALATGEPERVREALEAGRDDLRLLPHVLPLLGRFEELASVTAYLRGVAPRSVGAMLDTLLDRDGEVLIRRRVPAVIEAAGGSRALTGLCLALDDPDFEVRLECARAASRVVQRSPELLCGRESAFAWAEGELAVDDRVWEQRGRRRHGSERSALLEESQLGAVDRSVELVCTLFGLALGPEVMSSVLRAVYGPDEYLRGTGLEFLQTVLPERIRTALWPRIPGQPSTRSGVRSTQDIADELVRSARALRRARDGR